LEGRASSSERGAKTSADLSEGGLKEVISSCKKASEKKTSKEMELNWFFNYGDQVRG